MVSQINLFNSQLSLTEESLNHETNEFQREANQSCLYQLLNSEGLRRKTSALMSSANNPERERDFRKTCLLNQESFNLNSELNEAYQEYIKSYHKITSLYLIDWNGDENASSEEIFESEISDDEGDAINLYIYNTEIEKEQVKALNIPKTLIYRVRLTQLPNGELFCYGNRLNDSGISMIIGNDYKMRRLPSGIPYLASIAIYFNRSVYCFGGFVINVPDYQLSSKFDLDKNQWIKLASIPGSDTLCSSLTFNRNILISSLWRATLCLYSIDIDSFSTIPYEFEIYKWKILINTEERLYIIECHGSIYESEVGDEYNWKKISKSEINHITGSMYWVYNKEGIYIGCIDDEDFGTDPIIHYYKFNLDEKVLTKLSNPHYY